MSKYYYIITRQGGVNEIPFSQDGFMKTIEAWQGGGVVAFKAMGSDLPKAINTADIVEVLAGVDYQSWIKSSSPKRYLRDGTWRLGKDNEVCSHEPWKQIEMEKTKRLESEATKPLTEEQRAKSLQRIEEIKKKMWN